ncbi:PEGA domain-containing protein [Deltaproteobacteria bacterium TL4]
MKPVILMTGLLLSVVMASSSFAQSEKSQAAISPLASIGTISVAQQQIVFNSLLDKLSGYYDLISQEQFLKAQETAFEELEAQECTEEQCIRKIQELLQVENMFFLQMIREGNDTQLSLTLIDLEKKTVKSDYCPGCNTQTLNERVAQLVDKIRGARTIIPPPVTMMTEQVGKLFITSTPSGAEIFLDGQPLDNQTESLLENIPAGKHTLFLRKDNLSQTQELTVIPNKMLSLDLQLELSKASLFVTSTPFKAEVFLDGKRIGQTPIEVEATAGKHQVDLRLEGFMPVSKEVMVKFGETNKLEVPLTDGRGLRGFLSLTSNVENAAVQIKGGTYVSTRLEEKLPLNKKALPIGTYQLTLSKEGYESVNQTVSLDENKSTSTKIQLKVLPAVLEVRLFRTEIILENDGVFQLWINGKTAAPSSTAAKDSESSFVMELPEGQYQLEASHSSGKYEKRSKVVSLVKGQKYTEAFELRFSAEYLEHQAWKWKWGSALAGTIVSMGAWYTEETALQNANSDKNALIDQMYKAKTQKEAHNYHTQAAKKIEVARTHQQNAQLAALFSGGLAALTFWLWADEPQEPRAEATWNWQPGLYGETRIVYSKRW